MFLKRIFDLMMVVPVLILLMPVFVVLAIWIASDSKGPVFFRQNRVGENGKIFRIHKFRTMVVDAELVGNKVTVGEDPRITRFGRFLRKYKLDELPQLIDVLAGDMSLVGPRPEVPEFMDLYESSVRQRILSVKPGITDFASIEMIDENEILASFSDPRKAYINEILPIKQNYYLAYVDQHNLLLDIQIIIKTIFKIFSR